jgi:hypothetical protein
VWTDRRRGEPTNGADGLDSAAEETNRSWPGGRARTREKGRGLLVESSPLLSGEEMCGGGRVFRRCPTLPRPVGRSTIGAGGLSFRVRDGSGRFPSAVTTGTPHHPHQPVARLWGGVCGRWDMHSGREQFVRYAVVCRVSQHQACRDCLTCVWASPRPISTSPLNALRRLHVWPINPLVWWGP